MRYLLLLLLLGPLTGCFVIDDGMVYFDDGGPCQAHGVAAPSFYSTAEPPGAVVPAGGALPAQTREPPR